MVLLIFFALPLATILLAIVLEKIFNCPILVAITFFAIYLIVLFSLFASGTITNLGAGLVAIIVYTILAFITAYFVKIIGIIRDRFRDNNSCRNNLGTNDGNNLLRISCRCNNGESQDLMTINSDCSSNNDDITENRRFFINRRCNT